MPWAKPKFYYQTMLGSQGSTLTPTSTLPGTDVNNIFNMLEVNSWKLNATTDDPAYISYDGNVLTNRGFETWSAGPPNPPDDWTFVDSGSGGLVEKELTIVHHGTASVKLSYGTAFVRLYQDFANHKNYRGKTVYLIVAVKTAVASQARIIIDDGITETGSPYHDGDDTWQSLFVSKTISLNATQVRVKLSVEAATVAYFDLAGAGISVNADYFAIAGHNLNTADCSIKLQHSFDAVSYTDAFTAVLMDTDKAYVKEFTAPTNPKLFWRAVITGQNASGIAPYLRICIWGLKTELKYIYGDFAPDAQEAKANIGVSQGGYMTGIHTRHVERQIALSFRLMNPTLYDTLKQWWEISGLKNFFFAWDTADHAGDVFLVRPDTKFKNPFTAGGTRRNVTINLTGRRE